MVYSTLTLVDPEALSPDDQAEVDGAVERFGLEALGLRGSDLVLKVVNAGALPSDPTDVVNAVLGLPAQGIRKRVNSITFR